MIYYRLVIIHQVYVCYILQENYNQPLQINKVGIIPLSQINKLSQKIDYLSNLPLITQLDRRKPTMNG